MAVLIEKVVNCFTDCSTVPAEQYEYYTWLPLYQAEEEIDWYDSESSYSEQAEREPQREPVEIPRSQLQNMFQEYSKGGKTITADQSTAVARRTGFAPSRADEKRLKDQHGDSVTYEQLEKWMEGVKHPEDTVSHLMEIFKHFDKNKSGFLSINQIKNILTTHGDEDSLTAAEFDGFAKATNLRQDPVNYEQLCQRLLEIKQ